MFVELVLIVSTSIAGHGVMWLPDVNKLMWQNGVDSIAGYGVMWKKYTM